uniref:hypothetical protein n=1 Tax=uncultured Dysosmobacter sp. TaxID=2591384 RepID=UPI00262AEC71
ISSMPLLSVSSYPLLYHQIFILDTPRHRTNTVFLYFGEKDNLIADTFRKVTVMTKSGYTVFSYPELSWIYLQNNPYFAKPYIHAKFDCLNQFLIDAENIEMEEI